MKHLAPKKSKSVALKVVDKEDGEHQSEEFNREEFADLLGQFKKFIEKKNTKERVKCFECEGDSDSESRSEENTIALITTINLDEALQNNVNDGEPNIDHVLEKYDDLLAVSKKINKHNIELAKRVVVLEIENSRNAKMLQSSDAGPEIKVDKMISMSQRDGDKRGLGFDSINKSPAISVTKFFRSSLPTGAPTSQTTWRFIPTCHFCGALWHI
ncbi:unnamed protein product [Prunus armeniaca]